MLSILKPFWRNRAPRTKVPPDLWRIDLGPVAEPMTNGRTERMKTGVLQADLGHGVRRDGRTDQERRRE